MLKKDCEHYDLISVTYPDTGETVWLAFCDYYKRRELRMGFKDLCDPNCLMYESTGKETRRKNKQVFTILKQLHSRTGHPRFEIEGAGEPSVEAQYLGWIHHRKEGEGESAVYVIKDLYEDTSYATEFMTECLLLPKSSIEGLVKITLKSEAKEASTAIKGRYVVHNERWDDYSGTHDGSPAESHEVLAQLSLRIKDGNPLFSIKYRDKLTETREKKEEKTESKISKGLTCPLCKNEIRKEWAACPHCGTRLKDDTQIY